MSNPHKSNTTAHWEWECDKLGIPKNRGEGRDALKKRVQDHQQKSSSQLPASYPQPSSSSPPHQAVPSTSSSSSPSSLSRGNPSSSRSSSSSAAQSRQQQQQQPQPKQVGAIMIPSFTKLPKTGRFAIDRDGGLFFIILEKKLKHLGDFLARRWEDTGEVGHPVYLHGIQGVGKSHCLYYKAWELSKDPTYRVAYIPDCGGIADAPFSYLLQVCLFFGDVSFLFRSFLIFPISLGN